MIKIIEEHTNHIKPDPLYRITCTKCGTIFTANKSDMYVDYVAMHELALHIKCPVCHKINTEYYNGKNFERITE